MRTRVAPICLTLAMLVGSGCSSGGAPGGVLPAGKLVAGVPQAAVRETGSHRRITASLTIHIPKRVHRKGRFISPATQSLSYSIAPGAKCATCSSPISGDVGLTFGSPNCAPTYNGLACTIEFTLAAGDYIGSISTYDGPVGCQTTGACNTLSANQSFPLPIVAGKANAPSIALYGVPAYLAVYPASDNVSVEQAAPLNQANVFVPGVNATGSVSLYATDADENLILGPGSPTFSLPIAPGMNWTAAIKGNLLTLTTGSTFKPALTESFPIDLESPSCSITGADCALDIGLWIAPLLATVDTTNGEVHVYSANLSQWKLATYATITNGIEDPSDVKFDDTNGDLFVANVGTVTVYAPPYTGAPIATIPVPPIATRLAVDNTADIAVASSFISPAVYVYAAPGYSSNVTIPLSSNATGIVFDYPGYPDYSNLWIAQAGSVAQFVAPYTGSPSPNLGIAHPAGLDVDPLGNVYIANSVAGTLTQYVASNSFAAGLTFGSLVQPSAVSISGLINVCVSGGADQYFLNGAFADTVSSNSSTPCLLASDDAGDTFIASSPGANETAIQTFGYYFATLTYATGAIATFPSVRLLI